MKNKQASPLFKPASLLLAGSMISVCLGGCTLQQASNSVRLEVEKDLSTDEEKQSSLQTGQGYPASLVHYPILRDEQGHVLNFPSQQDYDFYSRNIDGKSSTSLDLESREMESFELQDQFLMSFPNWPVLTSRNEFTDDISLYLPEDYRIDEKCLLFANGLLMEVPFVFETGKNAQYQISLPSKSEDSRILGIYAESLLCKEVEVQAKKDQEVQCTWSYVEGKIEKPEDNSDGTYLGFWTIHDMEHPKVNVHR